MKMPVKAPLPRSAIHLSSGKVFISGDKHRSRKEEVAKISKLTFRLLTRDWNVGPGLLLPPQRNKDGHVRVASLQEEVDSQLDSQARENFLVPVAENEDKPTKEKMTNLVLRRAGTSNIESLFQLKCSFFLL